MKTETNARASQQRDEEERMRKKEKRDEHEDSTAEEDEEEDEEDSNECEDDTKPVEVEAEIGSGIGEVKEDGNNEETKDEKVTTFPMLMTRLAEDEDESGYTDCDESDGFDEKAAANHDVFPDEHLQEGDDQDENGSPHKKKKKQRKTTKAAFKNAIR